MGKRVPDMGYRRRPRAWIRGVSGTALVAILALGGCANIHKMELVRTDFAAASIQPVPGKRQTVKLGQPIITQTADEWTGMIELTDDYTTEWVRNMGTRAFPFTFHKGSTMKYVGTHRGVPVYDGPSTGGMVSASGSQIGAPYQLAIADDWSVKYVIVGASVLSETPGRVIAARKKMKPGAGATKIRQRLVYLGREGDRIKVAFTSVDESTGETKTSRTLALTLDDKQFIRFRQAAIKVYAATPDTVDFVIVDPFF